MVKSSVLAGIMAVALLLSYVDFPIVFLIAAGAYFAFRFFKLAIHGFGCSVCWTKTFLSGIIFLSLAIKPPIQMLIGLGLLILLGASVVLGGGSSKKKSHGG